MATHVYRKIDPTPDELLGMLNEAYVRPALELVGAYAAQASAATPPDWADLLDFAKQPEGVYARRHQLEGCGEGLVFAACWWTDRVGRRHWYIECAMSGDGSAFAAHFDQPEPEEDEGDEEETDTTPSPLLTQYHPLEWIAPEMSCGWRTLKGQRELVLMCGCGACGTVKELAWAGSTCGPCFDRTQDGEKRSGQPFVRRPIGLVHAYCLSATGLLISLRTATAQDPEGPDHFILNAHKAPWTDAALWSRPWNMGAGAILGCNDRVVAIADQAGKLVLLSAAGGPLSEHQVPEMTGWQYLEFAGADGNLLVGVATPREAPGEFRIWKCTEGTLSELVHRHTHTSMGSSQTIVGPGGRLILAELDRKLDVREASNGEPFETLAPEGANDINSLATAPNGAIYAGLTPRDINTHLLVRWSPSPATRPRKGWLSWLTGSARAPEATHELDVELKHLAVSPDGRFVAASLGDALALFDGATLEELGRFQTADWLIGPLAFAPSGDLVGLVNYHFVVWPWREMFRLS